jgi:hypothetical protein
VGASFHAGADAAAAVAAVAAAAVAVVPVPDFGGAVNTNPAGTVETETPDIAASADT